MVTNRHSFSRWPTFMSTDPYSAFRIADMLPDTRPRERLEQFGPESLTNPELIAILFRTGTPRRNAVQLAEELYRKFGGLPGLAQGSLDELSTLDGIGRVKAIELKAALELGKRLSTHSAEVRPVIRTPEDVAKLLMADLRYETREHLDLLVLDARSQVTRQSRISTGTLTESLIHPREVFREAIRYNAASVLLVHNHPSGDPDPSSVDIKATGRLYEGGKLLGIEVLDHVIIGDGTWASMKQLGLLP